MLKKDGLGERGRTEGVMPYVKEALAHLATGDTASAKAYLSKAESEITTLKNNGTLSSAAFDALNAKIKAVKLLYETEPTNLDKAYVLARYLEVLESTKSRIENEAKEGIIALLNTADKLQLPSEFLIDLDQDNYSLKMPELDGMIEHTRNKLDNYRRKQESSTPAP